jgi:hypothetical protein
MQVVESGMKSRSAAVADENYHFKGLGFISYVGLCTKSVIFRIHFKTWA